MAIKQVLSVAGSTKKLIYTVLLAIILSTVSHKAVDLFAILFLEGYTSAVKGLDRCPALD